MKKYSKILKIIAWLLSYMMVIHVTYEYTNMLWGIKYEGYSAPTHVALIWIIPYALVIIIMLIFAKTIDKKTKDIK